METTWLQEFGAWWRSGVPAFDEERARAIRRERLDHARREFLEMLADLKTSPALLHLRARVHAARGMTDLWHLRTDLFSEISVQRDQCEAQDRIDWLNRHFPTRAPRSGFGTLGAAELP